MNKLFKTTVFVLIIILISGFALADNPDSYVLTKEKDRVKQQKLTLRSIKSTFSEKERYSLWK